VKFFIGKSSAYCKTLFARFFSNLLMAALAKASQRFSHFIVWKNAVLLVSVLKITVSYHLALLPLCLAKLLIGLTFSKTLSKSVV
jgi:hypothetical protein